MSPYDSAEDTDEEVILGDDPVSPMEAAAVRSSRLGNRALGAVSTASGVSPEARKKLLERQEGERHLATPKMAQAGQWIPARPTSYVRNLDSEEEDTIMTDKLDDSVI